MNSLKAVLFVGIVLLFMASLYYLTRFITHFFSWQQIEGRSLLVNMIIFVPLTIAAVALMYWYFFIAGGRFGRLSLLPSSNL